jgi:hypothetical protein
MMRSRGYPNYSVTATEKFGASTMPTKSKHTESLTWGEAVAVAGTEHRLIAGVKRKTWEWWKGQNQVPAHRIMRLLKNSFEARAMHLPPTPAPPGLRAREGDGLSDPVIRAQEQVAAIFFRYKPESAEWGALIDFLNRFAPTAAAPPPTAQPDMEKRPGRRTR